MSSLVGDYASDSDDDSSFKGDMHEWEECYDESSGYNYYWNVRTNEVRWDKPSRFIPKKSQAKQQSNAKRDLKPLVVNKGPTTSTVALTKTTTTTATKKKGFIGPSFPEPTPEEIAISRIRKFENDLADGIINDIQKEVPADWKDSRPSSILYETNFKWNKLQLIHPTLEAKEKVKGSKNAIALIGGVYGDDDEDNNEDDTDQIAAEKNDDENSDGPPKKKSKKISVTMKPQNKGSKNVTLKPIPDAFLETSYDENGENRENENQSKTSFSKSAGSQYRKSIDAVAETLCDKLEALNVSGIYISPLKLLAIQIETLFNAWQSGALSSSYLQRILVEMTKRMSDIENNELAPPGWKSIWDSSEKTYMYENLITREVQKEKPEDDDDEDEQKEGEEEAKQMQQKKEENKADQNEKNEPEVLEIDDDDDDNGDVDDKNDKCSTTSPPLPPLPPPSKDSNEVLPPLPPNSPPPAVPPSSTSLPNAPSSPPSDVSGQVQDMELDEDENGSANQEDKNSKHIDDALHSFYMDLASINKDSCSNSPINNSPSVSPVPYPEDGSNSPIASDSADERKKRKTKISSALAMKKKGVGNLVAKWNNIQEQAKKAQ